MGGMAPVPTRGGRRLVDAALNLVPFIDLLSCCLSFLLITAVWSHVAGVTASQPGGAPAAPTRPAVSVAISDDGFVVAAGPTTRAIPSRGAERDWASLGTALIEARAGAVESVHLTIKAADRVRFDDVVKTIDAALAARFADFDVTGIGDGT
jgi:biopolymer transport protein ExbD